MGAQIAGRRWLLAALMLLAPAGAAGGQSERVSLPGSGYEVILDPAAAARGPGPPSPALIEAIAAWLSSSFELPMASEPPSFRFVVPDAMVELRHRGVASDHRSDVTIGSGSAETSALPDILAIYDDERRTIFLREDWRGQTAAELSIVVHEMVHHLQNMAGLRFECHEAREKTAFAAQEQWLALFGKDIATEFELDPFTLLVRTNCGF